MPSDGVNPKSQEQCCTTLNCLREISWNSISTSLKSSATLKSTITGLKWQATAEQWDLSSIWIFHKFVGRASGRATFQFIHTGSWNPIITIMMPSLLLPPPPPRRVFYESCKNARKFSQQECLFMKCWTRIKSAWGGEIKWSFRSPPATLGRISFSNFAPGRPA